MQRLVAGFAALSGCLAVAAGAIGSHLLRARVAPDALAMFGTANQYHLFHSLALLAVAALYGGGFASRWLTAAALCFAAGILLFSGSLYARVVFDARALGAPAPFGGTLLMVGWLLLFMASVRHGQ